MNNSTETTATLQPLEDSYLQDIQDRIEAATPGPWQEYWETHIGHKIEKVEGGCVTFENGGGTLLHIDPFDYGDWVEDEQAADEQVYHDIDFIANAREDIPALLGEVKRLRAENRKYRGLLSDHGCTEVAP